MRTLTSAMMYSSSFAVGAVFVARSMNCATSLGSRNPLSGSKREARSLDSRYEVAACDALSGRDPNACEQQLTVDIQLVKDVACAVRLAHVCAKEIISITCFA